MAMKLLNYVTLRARCKQLSRARCPLPKRRCLYAGCSRSELACRWPRRKTRTILLGTPLAISRGAGKQGCCTVACARRLSRWRAASALLHCLGITYMCKTCAGCGAPAASSQRHMPWRPLHATNELRAGESHACHLHCLCRIKRTYARCGAHAAHAHERHYAATLLDSRHFLIHACASWRF